MMIYCDSEKAKLLGKRNEAEIKNNICSYANKCERCNCLYLSTQVADHIPASLYWEIPVEERF